MRFEINVRDNLKRAGHRVVELDGRPLFTFARELEADVIRILSAAAAHEIMTGGDAWLIIDGRPKITPFGNLTNYRKFFADRERIKVVLPNGNTREMDI
jgi:hypothetical protein